MKEIQVILLTPHGFVGSIPKRRRCWYTLQLLMLSKARARYTDYVYSDVYFCELAIVVSCG